MGWLGAQGVGEVIERFVATIETLQRRCELAEDEQGRREKQSKGKRRTATAPELYRTTKEARRSHGGVFPMPAQSQGRHTRAWNAEDGRRPCSKSGEHCSTKLQNCHSFSKPNYSQFFVTTQKSPKIKVVQNQKFYNFAFITTP